jgi:choline dehydrogenase
MVVQELVPGKQYGDREALKRFVINEAWGHHASCTNAMGRRDDPDAVVDSRFNVIGTRGLRVVDASIFPRIPGFFPVAPIYMIAEKASDVIIADAGSVPTQ